MEEKSIEKTAALDPDMAADIELDDKGNPVVENQNGSVADSWKSVSDVAKERFALEKLQEYQERLKTGCAGLDEALGGGIYPGLIVLGGSPGVGKSTFALQIAAAVSEQIPVLYFSMEMTRERIAAKLISRYMYQHKKELCLDNPITADELISGISKQNPWGENVLNAVEQARLYVERTMKKLFINVKRLNADDVVKEVEKFMKEHQELPLPLVMVDYLQILPSVDDKDWNEKKIVEKSLAYMGDMAKDKEIPVILISSLSRGSYKTPMQIDSFKETGGIEYSADLLIGLQFQACHDKENGGKEMDLNAERNRKIRKVELTILKQRYGKSGNRVPMEYDAAHDYLWEEKAAKNSEENSQAEQEDQTVKRDDKEEQEAASQKEAEERDSRILGAVMCNTKVANEIRLGLYTPKQQTDCEVMKDVITKYSVSEKLTCFDCDVADAIYTLLSKYDRDNFTVRQVLRFLSGDEQQILTQQKSDNIIESIKRLRDTHIAIHCEAEMKKREKTEAKSFDGKFLNVICEETTRCKKNENSCENCREKNRKYRFDESNGPVMPLYAYGEKTRQMISFPRKLLYVRKKDGQKLSDTTETICIKRYLIRRLEILRNRKNKNAGFRNITFRAKGELADLLRELDKSSHKTKLQKQSKLHDTVTEILKYYQEIGYIQGYSDQKTYVKITGTVNDPWKLEALQQNETEESKEQEI